MSDAATLSEARTKRRKSIALMAVVVKWLVVQVVIKLVTMQSMKLVPKLVEMLVSEIAMAMLLKIPVVQLVTKLVMKLLALVPAGVDEAP